MSSDTRCIQHTKHIISQLSAPVLFLNQIKIHKIWKRFKRFKKCALWLCLPLTPTPIIIKNVPRSSHNKTFLFPFRYSFLVRKIQWSTEQKTKKKDKILAIVNYKTNPFFFTDAWANQRLGRLLRDNYEVSKKKKMHEKISEQSMPVAANGAVPLAMFYLH